MVTFVHELAHAYGVDDKTWVEIYNMFRECIMLKEIYDVQDKMELDAQR